MTALINGFLNVSRLGSGKLEIIRSSFDLAELISEQIDEIRLTVTTHQFGFNPAGLLTVFADHDKIGSVVSNLLSNAVKYSSKGEQVMIRASAQAGEMQVSVQDEGMGIRPQDLARIFDRYCRSGNEQNRNISGFGIGLYLCAEIIQRHEGSIWAESGDGSGSVFYFTLPPA